MFILFDEEKAILELAKRGLNAKWVSLKVTREPQVGWKCTNCTKILKLADCQHGHCPTCLSPDLENIFGDGEFLRLYKKRQKQLQEIKMLERRKRGPQQ